MPRTRGGDEMVGGRRGGGRRGRGRGVEPGGGRPEGREEVVRGARRGRGQGPRTRGGRGRTLQESDRSPLYIGDIITMDPSSLTVQPGFPMETPMHVKVLRRWNPNEPSTSHDDSWAESNATSELLRTFEASPSASQMPAESIETSELLRTFESAPSASQMPAESIETSELLRTFESAPSASQMPAESIETSTLLGTPLSSYSAQVPSPAEFMEISMTTDTPQGASEKARASSSVYGGRKRKLVYDAFDPELEDIVNYGSDQDEEDVDEDDDYGLLQGLQNDRIFIDSLNEAVEPANYDLLSEPSSSAISTGAPPSVCAPSAEPSSSASVSLNETIYGPHSLGEFTWEPLPIPAIPPHQRREKFTASVGPVSTFPTPYEAFVSIWDRSIMEYIAAETNRYAEQTLTIALNQGTLGGYSRKLHFNDTNADELYVYFALTLATGIVHKAELTEYWSINGDVFDTANFSHYMTYTRFIGLSQMLHFTDNEVDISHLSKSEAKIAKIAPIINHLNAKFQALYQLGQCIALDESLTQWKGWLNINQFIKNKAASKGIKTYEVCDSTSGYLWRFKVHAGRDQEENHELGYITSLVLELLKGLENKGHTVFMDNFYNSPILSRLLKSHGFDCAGTLRLNRQHVPAALKTLVKQPLAVGSVHGATSGDVDVMVWKDRNVVSLTSTYHGAASASRDGKTKPTLVHDYNVRMGGVDKKDQMLSAYPIERKRTLVWYKKFFRRLLNVSVLNAYILHKGSQAPEHPHPHLTKHRQFRKNLVKFILAKHGEERSVTLQPLHSGSDLKVKFSAEVVKHFPREYPYNEKLKQRKRGYCGVCRKRTQVMCITCNMALCLEECFVKFHS